MMKSLLTTVLAIAAISNFSIAQTVNYDIPIANTVGLELTSGDICTAPWVTEEAKQVSIGNSWGATWTSTNPGVATSILIELVFTVSDGVTPHPTTLNGIANNSVDPGAVVNCATGTPLSWNIDPADYNSMGSNTFLVDYTSSQTINQLDNLPYAGDPYMRVTVTYAGVGLSELNETPVELVRITDLMGRETEFTPNTPLIYVYSDGSVRREFRIE